jgi:hypothetical protein
MSTTLILVTILNVSPLPVYEQYATFKACDRVLKATIEASLSIHKGNASTPAQSSVNEGWSTLTTPVGRVILKAKCI